MKNEFEQTPLTIAASYGLFSIQLHKLLINFKIKVFIIYTRLGNEKIVELLLKNGANVSLLDENDRTALHYAVQNGNWNRAFRTDIQLKLFRKF